MTKTKQAEYHISINFGDTTLEGRGSSAVEALKAITKPTKISTKGVITISDGTKRAEMTWQPAKLKRLFYPLAQNILAKQLNYLMR